jgi:aminocarboxymuconate-semialdehyde decarboxylase
MIIDMHNHFFPAEAVRATASAEFGTRPDGTLTLVDPGGHATPLVSDLIDPDRQIASMRAQGIDRRTLVPPPFTLRYDLPVEAGIPWSRAVNDGIAEVAQSRPEAFIGFGTVPLQNPAAAVNELDRAVSELGLRGIEIATNIAGVELDDPGLAPFWSRLEAIGIPVLIHPHHVAGVERMGAFHLRNLIGNPVETALAASRLMFGGVLESYPGLKVILSHGGGALPGIAGRLEHARVVRSDVPGTRTIQDQMKQFYYDTIVFDPNHLQNLVSMVGADRVVIGTDAPFDMSEGNPVGFVTGSGLDEGSIKTILDNGARLLGMS